MFADITNFYERLVMMRIRDLAGQRLEEMEEPNYWEDVACIALNHLPARYVRHAVDFLSHLSDRERDEVDQEVQSAVDYALVAINGTRSGDSGR